MSVLTRRSIFAGAVAMLLTSKNYAQSDKPVVIMAGHDSWGDCLAWGRQDNDGDVWKKSEQFKRVRFEALYASYYTVLESKTWERNLRFRDLVWVLEAYYKEQQKWEPKYWKASGVRSAFISPHFFVAHQGKLVGVWTGMEYWKSDVLPLITKLVGP